MEKKGVLIVLFAIFFITLIAINACAENLPAIIIDVEPISNVAPLELKIPAEFNFKIRNNNVFDDIIEIYTLLDVDFYPKGPWSFKGQEEKEFILNVDPKYDATGNREISYFIKSNRVDKIEKKILVEVRPLLEILEINYPKEFTKDYTRLLIRIKNKEKTYFGDINIKIMSEFLEQDEKIFIDRKGEAEISIELDQKTIKELKLKPYSFELIMTFKTGEEFRHTITSELKETIDLNIEKTKKNNLVGQKINLEKTNNADFKQLVVTRYNMFSLISLFVSFSKEPTYTKWEGLTKVAVWEEALDTGQRFELEIKNYYLILIYIIILIIAAIIIPYIATKKRVSIRKKIKKIHAKGSDFALRVTLKIRNGGKEINNLTIIDFLPHLTRLHEEFQGRRPVKITHNSITWKMKKLGKKEEIILSYIIYSKVEVMGKFTIPRASLSFKENHKTVIEKSNESFIYSEPVKSEK